MRSVQIRLHAIVTKGWASTKNNQEPFKRWNESRAWLRVLSIKRSPTVQSHWPVGRLAINQMRIKYWTTRYSNTMYTLFLHIGFGNWAWQRWPWRWVALLFLLIVMMTQAINLAMPMRIPRSDGVCRNRAVLKLVTHIPTCAKAWVLTHNDCKHIVLRAWAVCRQYIIGSKLLVVVQMMNIFTN